MKEYVVRIEDDSVRSRHDRLKRLAQGSRKARKMDREDVEVEGDDDDVAQYLALVVHQEAKRKSAR